MAHASSTDEGPAAEPSLWKDPFAWYAMKSIRRPRTVFACAWLVILLMVGAGLPQFEQTESSDSIGRARTEFHFA